jgi:hypothetical protein
MQVAPMRAAPMRAAPMRAAPMRAAPTRARRAATAARALRAGDEGGEGDLPATDGDAETAELRSTDQETVDAAGQLFRVTMARTVTVRADSRGVHVGADVQELTLAVDADGVTPLPGHPSVLTRERHALDIMPCPDLDGRSQGTWRSTLAVYGSRRPGDLPGPDAADAEQTHELRGTIDVQVDDAATRTTFDDQLTHTVAQRTAAGTRSASAYLVRRGRPLGDLLTPVPRAALREVGDGYDALLAASHTRDVNELLFGYALAADQGFRLAERLWQSGLCMEVQEPGGPVQPISQETVLTLRPFPVSRLSGTRMRGGTIDAQVSGGFLSPERQAVPDPATFRYVAASTAAGEVRFRTVSKMGIGFGTVLLRPVESASLFEYRSTSDYAIDSFDAFEGELTTGAMRGTQSLASRVTVVPTEPRETEDRAFLLLATTDVRVTAAGSARSRGGEAPFAWEGKADFRISAAGTSHNPPASDAPPYEQVGPEQFRAERDTAGLLKLFRHEGRDYYAFDLGLSGVVGAHVASSTLRMGCGEDGTSTRALHYDNATRRYAQEVHDPGECFPGSGSDAYVRDLPLAYGAIGLRRTAPDPTTRRSEMFIGRYDPRDGVIAGREEVTVRGCRQLRGRDPLQLTDALGYVAAWRAPIDYDQGTCTFRYTVVWRFVVPPR